MKNGQAPMKLSAGAVEKRGALMPDRPAAAGMPPPPPAA